MAAQALGLVGSVVGGMFGGPIGAQIGGMLVGMLGNALFPPPAQEGPQLTDLKVMTSAYGMTLPLAFGTVRISGNCFWSTDLKKHKHTDTVGKGGGQEVNTYTYTVDIGFALCQGVIVGVRKIWANRTLVFDSGSDSGSTIIASEKLGGSIRVYPGSEDQMPDPTMQARDGIDNTPAYRGTAYIFFEGLELKEFNNALPQLEFEVVVHGGVTMGRPLDQDPFQVSQIGGGEPAGSIFALETGASYIGGFSSGATIIAAVHGKTFDLIADGVGGPPQNLRRWTLDERGNFVSSGGRAVDYPQMKSYSRTYVSDLPPGGPTLIQDYEVQWVGAAGLSNMFVGRGAPLEIGGSTISDAGTFPATYPALGIVADDGDELGRSLLDAIGDVATGFIQGAYPSADGSVCLVLTGATRGGIAERWHRFTFSGFSCHYDQSGDVEPGHNLSGFGRQTGNYFSCSGMTERDGVHLWTYSRGDGDLISCYKIDDDGILARIYVDSTPAGGGYYGVYADHGVCHIADRGQFAIFTRNQSIQKQNVILGDIVAEICRRSGLSEEDFDVSALTDEVIGVVFGNQMSYRAMLETLFTAYMIRGVEIDGQIRFVKLADAETIVIDPDDLAVREGGQRDNPPDQLRITRIQDLELPREVAIDYFAADADNQGGSQVETIQDARTVNVVKLQVPISLTDNEAKSIAGMNLFAMHASRDSYEFTTNLSYSHVIPTDVVSIALEGKTHHIRITSRNDGGDGIISFSGVSENLTVYQQVALGGIVKAGSQTVYSPGVTELVTMDAPPLQDTFGSAPLIYLAANGYDTTWRGATLFQSFDDGGSYQDTGISVENPTVIGRTTTALPAPATFGTWDESNTVTVFLSNRASELSNDSERNVLSGFNAAYIGGEIVSFRRAELIGPGQYRLSGLLRGQKGTEDKAKTHSIGDEFVLLNSNNMRTLPVDSSRIGQTLDLKAVTFDDSTTGTRVKKHPFKARNMTPLAPVHVRATKSTASANGDWVFGWTRRTRIGGAWRDGVDAQYVEGGAHVNGTYEVDIISLQNTWPNLTGATVVRTITNLQVDHAGSVYTAAQQTIDFGAPTTSICMRVFEVNAMVGRSPLLDTYFFQYSPPAFDGGPAADPSVGVTNLIPNMTSNTTPNGVAFANSNYFACPPWNAFAPGYNGWINDATGFPTNIGYQHTTPKVVQSYEIHPWDADNFPTRCPTSWTFEGSNDGTTWTTLDTQTGYASWVSGVMSTFTVSSTTPYLYHRLNISANGGNAYTGVRRLTMLG
ncbi:phage tail protein [Massilia sp. P8910]|uniref:phage tail protein n=1 Tax=Massilia antarctica TaxID=2765360 RepID=UPI001E5DCB6C|nr:phage tail protein [Massilia antarctica]MCE3608081.1 phage tail protein [Massilia antarctica]